MGNISICANKKNIHQNVKYEKIEHNGLSDYLDNRVSNFDDFDNSYSKEQKLAIEERKTKLKNKSNIIKQNLSKINNNY